MRIRIEMTVAIDDETQDALYERGYATEESIMDFLITAVGKELDKVKEKHETITIQ